MKNGKPQMIPLPIRAARVLARMGRPRGMSEDERGLCALGIAATPEERWQLLRNHLCASKQAVGRDKDKLHVTLIRQFLRALGKRPRRQAGALTRARKSP